MNICITYLPRDPRTEPNRARAESPQLSRAGPQVPNRTKTSRVPRSFELSHEPRDKPSQADRAELRDQPEPRANPEPQVKPELSRIKHRGEQRRFPNKAVPFPDRESGLESNRVSSRVQSLESSPSRSGA